MNNKFLAILHEMQELAKIPDVLNDPAISAKLDALAEEIRKYVEELENE